MNDREWLELAAKAAGIEINQARQSERDSAGYGDVGLWTSTATNWNPLTDDGDALRLAVKLNIQVVSQANGMSQAIWSTDAQTGFAVINESHDGDQYAATRRAIVRAAAEIGKGMK